MYLDFYEKRNMICFCCGETKPYRKESIVSELCLDCWIYALPKDDDENVFYFDRSLEWI